MTTSKKIASEAARELRNKQATKEEKSIAGSDLAQAKKSKKNNQPKERD